MEKTKYQKSEHRLIHRSQIKGAPYNPRKISEEGKRMLRKNIKERGLMGGLVWNEVTGNLVSGHQRIGVVDSLEKSEDYMIEVEVVQLDPKAEKEQNIFMNSPSAQGQFDFDLLSQLLQESEIDPSSAGLTDADLNVIGVEMLYEDEEETDEVQELRQVAELTKPPKKEKLDRADMSDEERIADMRAKKEAYKEKIAQEWEGESYFTVTFDTYQNKCAFLERLGLDKDERFVKGELLDRHIEVTKPF